MKKTLLLPALFLSLTITCFSQTEQIDRDTVIAGRLNEVILKAFEQNRQLKDVPAAVSYFGPSSLNRFNNTNILPALNTAPGVRMEERSPGSYRLNIRGSSLRSPFGVRNVKVYYNNIPLTDPGGNTFLNQLGYYNFQSVEIIKGPGSSLYGSGTGGVMLIESTLRDWTEGFNVNYSTGSYDHQNVSSSLRVGNENFQNTITYQHEASTGYRQQSAMKRDVLSWNTTVKGPGADVLSTNFLYGNLYYQTPGPLTLSEYNVNPRLARPHTSALPGSVENQAAIYQKTFLAGSTYTHSFNSDWKNTSTLYGAFTQLNNPTIRNYEKSNEPHFGGRTTFEFRHKTDGQELLWHAGVEIQQGLTSTIVYNNRKGLPDSLQTNDDINNLQAFVFTQLSWTKNGWNFTGGISLNQLKVQLTRLSVSPVSTQVRKYNNELAPRLAILRKLTETINVYASVARGFSPPTSAEVLPSGGIINTALNAEHGINYEAGLKGNAFKGRLNFDINTFFFQLNNTIVQRRDATGGDYFINAGSTKQNGVETSVSYQPILNQSFFSDSKFWLSHTWNNFHYKSFKQVTTDFSGNQLPSTAPNTVAAGADIVTKAGFYLNLTYYYSDRIALNDANTDWATSYNLLGARIGYRTLYHNKFPIDLFTGADNLFNVKYSLGNDINGFGGRYYNAAMGRNYFAGISLGFQSHK